MSTLLKIQEKKHNYNPEISVICCAKDASNFIEDSLNSIINQKSVLLNIMFLDDSSSDDTLIMAKKILESSNFSYTIYKSFKNIGVPKARNFLIKNCFTDFFAIHDADDISMPYRLSIQLNFLKRNNNIDVLGSRAIKIDEQDKLIEVMSYPPKNHDDISIMLTGKVNPMIDPTCVIKKSSFDSVGGYSEDEEIKLAQDFDLWIRMSKQGKKLANLDYPCIAYRIHNSGLTSSKKNDMIKAHVYVQNKHFSFLENIRRMHVRY